jgi:hypothetical protein
MLFFEKKNQKTAVMRRGPRFADSVFCAFFQKALLD